MPSPRSGEPPTDLRSGLFRLNESLLNATSPGEIEGSLSELEALGQSLRLLDTPPTPEVAVQLIALQADLKRAAQLVQSGLALQLGWARVLGAAAGGYTASGDAAPLFPPVQHSLQG